MAGSTCIIGLVRWVNVQSARTVTRRGLTNVLFKPYQPNEQLKYSLTLPDVHLVSLKPALEGPIVASKFTSSIAAGRVVNFIGAYLALAMARSPAMSRAAGAA